MTIAATAVPLSEAKARLSELARRVRQQHERITLTRNGEPEAALVSVDELEGLEMTLETSATPRRSPASPRAWPRSAAANPVPTWPPSGGSVQCR
jgi:prevent-host-death family protein